MSKKNKLTEEFAREVWDILVKTCGAQTDSSGHGWLSFKSYVTDEHSWHEFRFMGVLGFGGKLYINRASIHVACYPEDRNPERDRRIKLANEKLAALCASRTL